jgi:hypothetical protein
MAWSAAFTAHGEQVAKAEKQEKEKIAASAAGTEETADFYEFYSRDETHVIETEGKRGEKKKKFPWLLIAGGVVAVVVLYVTVVKKEKYELKVEMGEGVTGSSAETQRYKKGTVVNFNYSLQPGYEQLSVKLDGADFDAAGIIKMYSPHAISVKAMKSIPAGTYSGTTDQGYPVELRVSNASDVSALTYYRITMDSDVNNYGYSIHLTLSGSSSELISDYIFSFSDSKSALDLTGTFTTSGIPGVTGNWDLHYDSFIYGVFAGKGTYAASLTAAKSTGNFSRLRPGEVKITGVILKNGKVINRVSR